LPAGSRAKVGGEPPKKFKAAAEKFISRRLEPLLKEFADATADDARLQANKASMPAQAFKFADRANTWAEATKQKLEALASGSMPWPPTLVMKVFFDELHDEFYKHDEKVNLFGKAMAYADSCREEEEVEALEDDATSAAAESSATARSPRPSASPSLL